MNQYPSPEEYEAQKQRLRAVRVLQIAIIIALVALFVLYFRLAG